MPTSRTSRDKLLHHCVTAPPKCRWRGAPPEPDESVENARHAQPVPEAPACLTTVASMKRLMRITPHLLGCRPNYPLLARKNQRSRLLQQVEEMSQRVSLS